MSQRQYFAEFIGTYFLLFCGTGAVVSAQLYPGTVDHLTIAVTFGLIVTAMVYAIGEISGAHINPAVTISFAVAGSFPWGKVAPYILAQCLGAVAASGTLRLLFPEVPSLGETLPAGSVMQSFVLEIIISFLLMFVIICVVNNSEQVGWLAGLTIGFTVLLAAAFAGPVSGASMNPARSLGPALVNGKLTELWIYLVAPVIGMVLSIGVWRLLREPKEE